MYKFVTLYYTSDHVCPELITVVILYNIIKNVSVLNVLNGIYYILIIKCKTYGEVCMLEWGTFLKHALIINFTVQ
jgi:hypothetical protein